MSPTISNYFCLLLFKTRTTQYDQLCRNIIKDMNEYGLSVVDDFLGVEKGLKVLAEVHHMYSAGIFQVCLFYREEL